MSGTENKTQRLQVVVDAGDVLRSVIEACRGQVITGADLSWLFRLVHAVKTSARAADSRGVEDCALQVESWAERCQTQSECGADPAVALATLSRLLADCDGEGVGTARSKDASSATRASTPESAGQEPGMSPASDIDESNFFFAALDPEPVDSNQFPAEFLIKFVAESEEHLSKLEDVLVAIEAGTATDEQLGEAFRAMHSLKGNCGICGFSDMERLTHHAETLMGEFRDKRCSLGEGGISLLLEMVDVLRGVLATIPGGDGSVPNLNVFIASFESLQHGEQPPPSSAVMSSQDRWEPLAGQPKRPNGAGKSGGSIRVDTEKLDNLMNLVGELIIAETTVTKNPDLEGHEFENFQKAALNLNRLTRGLQDVAMAVRMVPIASAFRKMSRLVRDVSAKQRKRVELICTGEETEVDKTVIEAIADPLVHLIRNSVDHGIESSLERGNAAKEPVGHVWLDAKHQGGEVWITIRDDGRGLNTEKILVKALDRGIADPASRYTEREIFDFIFAPGFSTAEVITDISGRGVGMDVVRRNLEAVNGRIDVSSEPGRGTTFVLRIPLTLAIIEGMLVRVGRAHYTIPLLAIRESVRAEETSITRLSNGRELLKLRSKHYPIVKLSEFCGTQGGGVSVMDGILVVVETSERLVCVLVDEVVGQLQTVIKPLPEYLRRVRGLAGCSILHNGEISLILDVERVVGAAENRAA